MTALDRQLACDAALEAAPALDTDALHAFVFSLSDGQRDALFEALATIEAEAARDGVLGADGMLSR